MNATPGPSPAVDGTAPPLSTVVVFGATVVLALALTLPPAFNLGGDKRLWQLGFVHLAYLGFKLGGEVHHYSASMWWMAAALFGGACALLGGLVCQSTKGRQGTTVVILGAILAAVAALVAVRTFGPGVALGVGAWGVIAAGTIATLAGLGVMFGQTSGPARTQPLTILAGLSTVALVCAAVPALQSKSGSGNYSDSTYNSTNTFSTTNTTGYTYNPPGLATTSPPQTSSTIPPSLDPGTGPIVFTTGLVETGATSTGYKVQLREDRGGGVAVDKTGLPVDSERALSISGDCVTDTAHALFVPVTTQVARQDNSGISAKVHIDFNTTDVGGSAIFLFSSGPQCVSATNMGVDIQDVTGTGRVQWWYVLPNAITPAHPEGDPSVMKATNLLALPKMTVQDEPISQVSVWGLDVDTCTQGVATGAVVVMEVPTPVNDSTDPAQQCGLVEQGSPITVSSS